MAVVGVVWIGSQNRRHPLRGQTDKLGDALPIQRADVAAPIDARLIRSQLGRWIDDVRSVYTDVAAQRHLIDEAYAMVDQSGRVRTTERLVPRAQQLHSPEAQTYNDRQRSRSSRCCRCRRTPGASSGKRSPARVMDPMCVQRAVAGGDHDRDQAARPRTRTLLVNPTGLFVKTFNWQQRQQGLPRHHEGHSTSPKPCSARSRSSLRRSRLLPQPQTGVPPLAPARGRRTGSCAAMLGDDVAAAAPDRRLSLPRTAKEQHAAFSGASVARPTRDAGSLVRMARSASLYGATVPSIVCATPLRAQCRPAAGRDRELGQRGRQRALEGHAGHQRLRPNLRSRTC